MTSAFATSATYSRLPPKSGAEGPADEKLQSFPLYLRKLTLAEVAEWSQVDPKQTRNSAARLQQLADPGGICVSGKVANEVEKKLAFGFEPMGEQHVRNIAEPIEAFRVKVDGAPRRRMKPRTAKRVWAWATSAMMAIMMIATWFVTTKPGNAPALSDIPSIAVLPFDDMSPEHNLGYLGDGVAQLLEANRTTTQLLR